MAVHPFLRLLLFPLCRLWLRKVEGLRNVPMNGHYIIAVNHSSYYDAVIVHAILVPKLNKKIHSFVNSQFWKYPVIREILDSGECIPVYVSKEKDAAKKNKMAFQKAVGYLAKGGIVEIFPEGTRSPDGKLKKAYTGIAKLALKAQVPVLPFGIIDAHKVLPKGKSFPKFRRCEVRIGKPIYFKEHYNKKPNVKVFEEVTRKIMKELARLIGQSYNY